MSARVLQPTSPNVYQHHAKDGASKKPSQWAITNFLSTQDEKQYKFLSKVYIPERTASMTAKDNDLRNNYLKNFHSFHRDLYSNAPILEEIFKRATKDTTKLFFIHAVCDAAHSYTYAPNADPRLQNLANRLLDAHLGLFQKNSYIPESKFLSNKTSFSSLYLKNEQGMCVVAPYGPHFGNVLFRLTPNGDICFSPLFINYVNRDLSTVDSKECRYENLAKDRHFYTSGPVGFETLTNRDAVAHYRWLTEVASHTEFTTYLTHIGHTTHKDEYQCQERKALLAELSKQYFCLGQGVTVERMPATISPSPTKVQMPRPPINMQDTSTSPMKQNTRSLGTDRRSPDSLGITSSDSQGSFDDEHVGSRKRSLSDSALHTQNAGWEHVRGSQKSINIHKHYHYHGAPRSNAATLPFAQNVTQIRKDIQVELPRAEAAYPKRRYHPPIQTALHASHAAWKHPHQHYIPQAVHIPSVTPKPVYLDVTPVKNCYYWIPADTPKVEKSLRYKFWSFCSKVIDNIRYS